MITGNLSNRFVYFFLAMAMLTVLLARLHLLSFPFERDEGEYAYMGQLILDGHPPYTLAYNMKLPGTYYMYALIMGVFGESVVGVHLGLTCVIMASMFLLFLISTNFVSKTGAVISAATFGIMGTSWTLFGQAAHATHFVIFFALAGIYILLQLYKNNRQALPGYFMCGFLFSLAFICKQSGLFFAFFGAAIIIVRGFRTQPLFQLIKKLSFFSLGFATPVLIMLWYLYAFGDFDRFWFWTVKYLSKYGTQIPVSEAPAMFKAAVNIITSNYDAVGYTALWSISMIGIPFIFIKENTAQNKTILFLFFLFSFLTILPGFYFRNHYFITLLPAIGLTTAVCFDYSRDLFIQKLKMPGLAFLPFLVFVVIAGTRVYVNREYLFSLDPKIVCKQIYGPNPFVESIEIASFIKQRTTANDKIAILGSEPQIFFYANRYSATGYIYTYNLVELHSYALDMQKEMIREVETNKPKYVIHIASLTSWGTQPESERYIFEWSAAYIKRNYTLVGIMDLYPNLISELKVGTPLNNDTSESKHAIYLYESND